MNKPKKKRRIIKDNGINKDEKPRKLKLIEINNGVSNKTLLIKNNSI